MKSRAFLSLVFVSLAVMALSLLPKHGVKAYQTPANSCPTGQALTSSLVNIGQGCSAMPAAYLKGTSGTITGTLLALGGFDSGLATVAGATAGMSCGQVSTTDGAVMGSYVLQCTVTGSGANNVTVTVTAGVAGIPPSKAYNFIVSP